MPFMTVNRPTRWPLTRPVLPRTSSAASGFFFCGMIEEPVEKESESRTKPNCGVDQMMISSASRDGVLQRLGDPLAFLLDPESQIDRHLIVARASGVQAAGGRADQVCKAGLDIHVDVFKFRREFERPGLDLFQDRVQAVSDFFLIGRRNDARLRQHLAMGDRSADVLCVEFAVEGDRRVDRFHDRGRTRGKTSAPHLVAGLLVAHRYNPCSGAVFKKMADGNKFFPLPRLIVAALVAGVLAGAVAVYVSESGSGNNAPPQAASADG